MIFIYFYRSLNEQKIETIDGGKIIRGIRQYKVYIALLV